MPNPLNSAKVAIGNGAHSQIRWHGDGVKAVLTGILSKRQKKIGQFLVDIIREKTNVSGWGPMGRGYKPAPRGSYPHKRTGELNEDIGFGQSGLNLRVGAGLESKRYSGRLEDPSDLDRPFLLNTVQDNIAKIAKMMGDG